MKAEAEALLRWYDAHRRELPWRAPPGERAEPYRVWLSEIMLQQTVAAAAGPYFLRFVERWPDVGALAAASLDEVLQAWQGLGYYARARNLHAAARIVAAQHGGRFPDSEAGLRALPGVGAYTAAAIAAIAFERKAVVVDGNVERVMARLFRVETPLPAAKKAIRDAAAELTPDERPGDYAQAVMDLGATVCLPRRPRCGACPWSGGCLARAAGIAESLPVKAPKRERPVRRGIAYWTEDGAGRVLLRRRPENGLLGGMMEVPSGPWVEEGPPPEDPAGRRRMGAARRRRPARLHAFHPRTGRADRQKRRRRPRGLRLGAPRRSRQLRPAHGHEEGRPACARREGSANLNI